jgi:hypothetical protein
MAMSTSENTPALRKSTLPPPEKKSEQLDNISGGRVNLPLQLGCLTPTLFRDRARLVLTTVVNQEKTNIVNILEHT